MSFLMFTTLIEKLISMGLDGLAKSNNSNITDEIKKAVKEAIADKSAAEQLSEMIKANKEVK